MVFSRQYATPRAWRLLKLGAQREQGKLGGRSLHTIHFLLALSRFKTGDAVGNLHVLCGDMRRLQKTSVASISAGAVDVETTAEEIFRLAEVEAVARNSNRVDLEDILIALVKAPGLAAFILGYLGVTPETLRQALAMKCAK